MKEPGTYIKPTRNICRLRGPKYGNPGGSSFHNTTYVPQDEKKCASKLVFGRDIIIPINHISDWRYIHHRKQTKINKDVYRENTTRIDHDYRVGY